MNKTASLLYLCVMILKCIWNFHNAYGKQQIHVRLNHTGKYTSDIKNFEIVFPQRVNKDGSFMSHRVQHRHSKRSTSELEYIFYKIPIRGKDYLIELTPNRKLIAPGAVVEIRKEDTRKSSKVKFFNENNSSETLQKMFENLEIKKLENTECHFSGRVKGENFSKAALSTCYGLAGFIQIKQGFYTIEPTAEHDPFIEDSHPHILYKEDGLENSTTSHAIRNMANTLLATVVRKRRESCIGSSAPMFAETLIVMDKTMINHHRHSDCENYVLTVFNMAFNLFRDASVGMLMTLTVVRIIRLETEDDQINIKLNENAEKTLRYFQKWQYEINPGDDTHPNHHDIALLLTRVNVCCSPTSRGILGITTMGKACDPKESAALCEDSGLRLGYVIAHEIGHLLGADHDTNNSACEETKEGKLRTVMHPHISLASKTWSKSSQAYFKEFFKTTENCFLDEPEEHHFNEQDLPPGVMYNANFQCKYLFSLNSRECEMGSTCTSLNCHIPGYACIVTHTPPADGTRCGEGMWCHNSKCLVVGERPGAVDGNWGEWSAWSDCTRTCGSGVASSVRNCDRPQPAHGGKNCVDLIRFISEEVNVSFVGKPCETGRPSFRDIQCGEFNDWIYPEDGKIHSWKAHYFHEGNPCVLHCINEEKAVAALRPRVVDGTMCYRGIRDLCIAGACKSLPCDLQFGSNAVEDVCGVCHGDGTGCEFSQGVQTLPKLTKGLTKLMNIPTGTKNIKVEELSPTLARIIVRDKDTKDIYVRGKNLGIFNVPGSQAWLGMIKKDQEALHIPGPVSKPLSVWIHRLENVSVKWSMALPAEQQRKPEFMWDFLKWGLCSAECGPGIQTSDPSCVEEKAGLVEDSFCADLQIPAPKVRPCEVAKCTPRWMVGDWKYCDKPNSQEKMKKRAVYCIKKIGEGDGESEIVPDSECKDPRPHSVEPCESRQKREDTQYNYLEEESMYNSDSSEYGFHKKYDNYLKHFGALSVPQKKSETIPFRLVSSPHFRHYFHVLETPEDRDTNSVEVDDFNINSKDNSTDRILNRISSDFYKDTFSGHQVDVSHLSCKLSVKKRKSISPDKPKRIKKRTKQKVVDKTIQKRYEKKGNGREGHNTHNLSRRSNPLFYQSPYPQTQFLVYGNKILDNSKLHEGWKTSLITCQTKNLFSKVGTTCQRRKKNQRRKLSENKFILRCGIPYQVRQKLKKREFFSKKVNASNARLKEKNKMSDIGKEGLRKLNFLEPLTLESNQGDMNTNLLSNKRKKYYRNTDNFFSDSYDCSSYRSRNCKKWEQSKKLNFETKKAFSKAHFKRHFPRRKGKQCPNFTFRKLNKAKRSNRKWKKTKSKDTYLKSSKDSSGSACGIETRKYLNNLFRENRPKVSPQKPQKIIRLNPKPIIESGKVVIDRDSVDDKEMEILFLDEDNEEKQEKNKQLPRPPINETRLSLKGQEVFDLIQKLQRRSCLYRENNDTDENAKPEMGVKVVKDFTEGKEVTTQQHTERENKTENTSTTAPNGTKATITTTPSSTVQNQTTATTMKQHKTNNTTETVETTKTTKTTETIETTKTTKTPETTESQTRTTTGDSENASKNDTKEEITVGNSEVDENYDIDEIIPYPPGPQITTEDLRTKKKKKKKKGKKKKYKGPFLEDYELDIGEGQEQNKTTGESTLSYYFLKDLKNRKKRNRMLRRRDFFLY